MFIQHHLDNEIYSLVVRKQKTATWFVSHCEVASHREDLTRKLQQFINVDVYGKCGTLSCPRHSSECDLMLNTTYKFYFAFENTLCVDYLTEKSILVMNSYIIPVIYSGVELSRFLPPKSYIDANAFATVEELANYLIFLSENPHEYIKYFWWKQFYKISSSDDVQQMICVVCRRLNELNFKLKKQTYGSIQDWFYKDACKEPKIKF